MWLESANRYVTFIINWSLVNNALATQLSLFLDGYESSTKDHEHLRRTKHLCGTLIIAEDMVHFVTKEKFCDNPKNKAQLVPLIAKRAKERLPEINVMECRDDADTEIVKGALDASRYGPVEVCILIIYLLLQRRINVSDYFIPNYFIFRFLLMRVWIMLIIFTGKNRRYRQSGHGS